MFKQAGNVLLTAVLVAVATVLTAMLVAVVVFLLSGVDSVVKPIPEAGPVVNAVNAVFAVLFGCLFTAFFGGVTGALCAVITVPAAAVTMPAVLWFAQQFKLPRPLVDVVGGALAALCCALYVVDELDGHRMAEGLEGREPLVALIALLAGALLGRLRHAMLFPEGASAPPARA